MKSHRNGKKGKANVKASLKRKLSYTRVGLVNAMMLAGAAQAQDTSTNNPSGTVATNAPGTLPDVVVKGQREETYKPELSGSSPKFTEPLRDTPQSISVVPRQVIEDQGATSLRDALRNVSGISIAAGEGGAQGDNLTLRGFSARNDIFLDGMRDFGSYYRDSFNYDQVEVLKGPASVMFGRGSTGGVLNQVSKTPGMQRFIDGSFSLGTDITKRATLDMNTPVPVGTGTAARLNLMANDSEVTDRDAARYQRFGVAPSVSFGLGTSTRANLSYVHQSEDNIPDYGLPWLFDRPAPVDRSNFYGFEDHDFLKTGVDIGTARLEHDFNEKFTLRDQFRYANYDREGQISEARIPAGVTPATPIDTINVLRNQIAVESTETFLQNQIDLLSKFSTGPVDHTLVTGIEAGRETSDPTRFTFTGVPTTSLVHPDKDQDFAGRGTPTTRVRTTATTVGIYAVDTLKLTDQWELMGGFRYDHFDVSYREEIAGLAFDHVDDLPSWRAGVVYKPIHNGSIYFQYGTSFNPSAEALSLSRANQGLDPESNETFELGTKWDLLNEKLSLRGAIFRSEKDNARETDPLNSNFTVLAGEQRVDGVEVEAAGHITDDWQIFAGYTFLHSEVVSSKFFPNAVGARLANVPEHTFTLWTTYRLPYGFTIGGGPRYVGSRTASSTVPVDPSTGRVKEAPGYWVVDAMVKYEITKNFDLQVNIYNLADEDYYDQVHPSHIVPGAGLSALFSANFRF
jgi:catecholate siderophore receptor